MIQVRAWMVTTTTAEVLSGRRDRFKWSPPGSAATWRSWSAGPVDDGAVAPRLTGKGFAGSTGMSCAFKTDHGRRGGSARFFAAAASIRRPEIAGVSSAPSSKVLGDSLWSASRNARRKFESKQSIAARA